MTSHQRRRHPNNERIPPTFLKCPTCSYVAKTPFRARRHALTHTNQRPFACPHCLYAARQSQDLKIHQQRHHPEKVLSVRKSQQDLNIQPCDPKGRAAGKVPVNDKKGSGKSVMPAVVAGRIQKHKLNSLSPAARTAVSMPQQRPGRLKSHPAVNVKVIKTPPKAARKGRSSGEPSEKAQVTEIPTAVPTTNRTKMALLSIQTSRLPSKGAKTTAPLATALFLPTRPAWESTSEST